MNEQAHKQAFRSYARERLENGQEPARILEVGGGKSPAVAVDGAHYTVLDVSEASASRSTFADEVVIANAEEHEFPANSFDAIIFWNVLEHVPNPEAALQRAAAALKPGGVIVVAGPILRSFKALITRVTPHRLHVFYYRRVLGMKVAGMPGHSPFPVKHSPSASLEEISRILKRLRFRQVYFDSFRGVHVERLRERWINAYRMYAWLAKATSLLSQGRYAAQDTEFILVMESPAIGAAAVEQRQDDERVRHSLG